VEVLSAANALEELFRRLPRGRHRKALLEVAAHHEGNLCVIPVGRMASDRSRCQDFQLAQGSLVRWNGDQRPDTAQADTDKQGEQCNAEEDRAGQREMAIPGTHWGQLLDWQFAA